MNSERPPLRGALIGCGYVSERQLRAWRQIEDAKIVAVCDLDRGKTEKRAAEYGIPGVFTDVETMFSELELDFVDIATRSSTHLGLVTMAAERGLHVLCQKPIADSLSEAREITEVCAQAGVALMINENSRHQAWFRQAKVLIEEGALGRLYYARFAMRSRRSLPAVTFENQPYFAEMPRLMVYEMGVHFLDTARYLFGEADAVYARLNRVSPHIVGEDAAVVMTSFGDLTCLVDASWCSVTEPGPRVPWGSVQIEGDKGTLKLTLDGVLTLYTDDGSRAWSFPEDTIARAFVGTQQHFIDALRAGTEPETSGAETLKTMALVFGAYSSAERGQIVRLEDVAA